ncbi:MULTISPECIES: hypothetical protein [Fictibacillus]|uniref:Uncharacterized protein n=1 Tax=Fictibacillus enclensis TaxID=1017270 RepID=A0A0V8J865_9BACL|nr:MULTISPECIES: hypothetical protein [Fictibacillus]KSU83383.1 hypothetical protein AS030_12510 [Fictibacillus enclensis]MDM5200379.1 hypothetical protein [Fictibacillus enclensis]RXZ02220.1 hypothetical protein DMO16_22715 [Fictibacillus sp. S7]WHY71160.1 hypothetical protein QNH15_19350 [Fictibacillus enclensis]SCC14664.1 hypothetical protein GA0061096_2633 [Fictibacillus enclensis]
MDFKRLLQWMYYLQIAFFVSGIYLLFVYILTSNTKRIQVMIGVLCFNLIAIKLMKDRYKI